MKSTGWLLFLPVVLAFHLANAAEKPRHHIWMEAELFGPLNGGNFSFQQEAKTTKNAWSVGGPGVAAEWTMGGESEWMSIAARADATNGVTVSQSIDVPEGADYTLWVRYMDYRQKEEAFGVRVTQGTTKWEHIFGKQPVVDELDPMLLLWDFSFAWDKASVPLKKGAATVELFTTGPTQARRAVDCLCLTTDSTYQPAGREKPDFATWRIMRQMRSEPVHSPQWQKDYPFPSTWKIADQPPIFVWNSGESWLKELTRPEDQRVEYPFEVDPPLLTNFLTAFRGKAPAIYSSALSGPAVNISRYPSIFTNGSPFLDWLTRHPERKFCLLLNYSEPNWPKNPDKAQVYANFSKYEKQFAGFISGESIAHAHTDGGHLDKIVKTAKTRGEILEGLREMHTASVVKKFSDYFGKTVTPEEAWEHVISCLSANMECFAHALCHWGVRRLGHENTGNSPTLARRLAFMRGAAKQFDAKFFNYQSCNLGDAATMYSRQAFMYPASSKYVLDNSYDAFAGAGHHWLLKDYLLWYLAGVDGFYNEQGVDMFWKTGGNAAGDDFPIQLSPKGRTAEAVLKLVQDHPRGNQFTPVAILMDEAHGWSQERFNPGGFAMHWSSNPALLRPGKHEAAIRGLFDVAYFPAPETQNEPASGIRQTFVSGMFGDIFDVIVNTPDKEKILFVYPVTFAAGEVPLEEKWGNALNQYMQAGGTLVVSADQFSGPGAEKLPLPKLGKTKEAAGFRWVPGKLDYSAQLFRYYQTSDADVEVLAKTSQGDALVTARKVGRGKLVFVSVPLGLGMDERPVPVLALLMKRLTEGLVPLRVQGDVEWTLDKLEDGGWLVALFNNRGVIKPQHGVLPTDERQIAEVQLQMPWKIRKSTEWITNRKVDWKSSPSSSQTALTLPAGAVRFVAVYPD
jgi:hypothetical protein